MCLTSKGWAYGTLEELNIRTFMPLQEVLDRILAQETTLLGPGTLVCLTRRASPPDLFCYLVFEPAEQCTTCGGKGMESWSEPFSQSSAAVCPDCLGDGFKKPG